jgi:hypothetical protein
MSVTARRWFWHRTCFIAGNFVAEKEWKMRRVFRDYSLGIVLFVLFVLSWAAQTWTGWKEFVSDQRTHQETAHWTGSDGYLWSWAQATFENWQSEFLQLFAMVALTSFLIFKGSPESRDGDDEIREKLTRVEQQLREIIAAQQSNIPPKA